MHSPILRRTALLVATFAATLPSANAQATFEVVSIKPLKEADNRIMIRQMPGGRFNAVGANLRILIGLAFDVRDFQISGGPEWMRTDRYEVNAKADTTADRIPQDQMRQMMRAMLADRFQLKTHEEEKELPVYQLVVGKNGPKLKESTAAPGPDGQRNQQMRMGRGQLTATGITMTGLAQQLSQQLGRPVIDKTGLQGNYDFELEWTPDPGAGPFGGAPPSPDGAPSGADAGGASIFTVLQEKLGLKLDSAKGPVKTLVIDSVSKPTEN